MRAALRDLSAIAALLAFAVLVVALPWGHPLLGKIARAAERLG